MEQNQQQWTTIIKPRTGWFDIDLKELWQYRDLVVMFVKRSFATLYKQTILGPAWILINPLLTTVIFTVVFGNIAGLAESGVPSFLFYMAGNAIWSFFLHRRHGQHLRGQCGALRQGILPPADHAHLPGGHLLHQPSHPDADVLLLLGVVLFLRPGIRHRADEPVGAGAAGGGVACVIGGGGGDRDSLSCSSTCDCFGDSRRVRGRRSWRR